MAVHEEVTQSNRKSHVGAIRKHIVRREAKAVSKVKSTTDRAPPASLTTDSSNSGHLPEVEDVDHYVIIKVGPDLRALHGADEKSRIHRSMLLASDSLDLRDALRSGRVLDTFGFCKCLRGSAFPFDDSRSCFGAWMDDASPETGRFLVDGTRGPDPANSNNLCAFCKRRKQWQMINNDKTSIQRNQAAKKPTCKNVDSPHASFSYQTDIGLYIKDYRRYRAAGIQGAAPVLGKDVPDPYLERIRSFSHIVEKLALLTANKSPPKDAKDRKSNRVSSASSGTEQSSRCRRQTPERHLSRVDTINLTPVGGRPHNLHNNVGLTPVGGRRHNLHTTTNLASVGGRANNLYTTIRELVHQTKRRSKKVSDDGGGHAGVDNFRLESKDKGQNKVVTQVTQDRIVCNHAPAAVPTKKPYPNSGLAKCKKFSSSTQYLDLTSPRVSFALPVHGSLEPAAGGRPRAARVRPLPRCRSAASAHSPSTKPNSVASTSSGFWSSEGSARSEAANSSKPIPHRLLRSHTIDDGVSAVSERRTKAKPLPYAKSWTFLIADAARIGQPEETSGRLPEVRLSKHDQQSH